MKQLIPALNNHLGANCSSLYEPFPTIAPISDEITQFTPCDMVSVYYNHKKY